jgi:hypothetical protein
VALRFAAGDLDRRQLARGTSVLRERIASVDEQYAG